MKTKHILCLGVGGFAHCPNGSVYHFTLLQCGKQGEKRASFYFGI